MPCRKLSVCQSCGKLETHSAQVDVEGFERAIKFFDNLYSNHTYSKDRHMITGIKSAQFTLKAHRNERKLQAMEYEQKKYDDAVYICHMFKTKRRRTEYVNGKKDFEKRRVPEDCPRKMEHMIMKQRGKLK